MSELNDAQLLAELQQYGEENTTITAKNRTILVKKLNHLRARKEMAAREAANEQRRRSPGRKRASIGQVTSTMSEAEERNLRRRTIGVGTPDKTLPKPAIYNQTPAIYSPSPAIHSPTPAINQIGRKSPSSSIFSSTPKSDEIDTKKKKSTLSWETSTLMRDSVKAGQKTNERATWKMSDSEDDSNTHAEDRTRGVTFGSFGTNKKSKNGYLPADKVIFPKEAFLKISPRTILYSVASLFVAIICIYIFKISTTSQYHLLIEGDQSASSVLENLLINMALRNGDIICSADKQEKMWMNVNDIKKLISQVGGDGVDVNLTMNHLLSKPVPELSYANADMNMVSNGDVISYVMLAQAQLSFRCRVQRAIVFLTWKVLAVSASVVLLILAVLLIWFLRKRKQRYQRDIKNMANEIIGLVKSKTELAQRDDKLQAFVYMRQVRDSLIPTNQRETKKQLWNAALNWLLVNEPRLVASVEVMGDEEMDAWRWVENNQPSFYSAQPSQNTLPKPVFSSRIESQLKASDIKAIQSCIKICNLLEPDSSWLPMDIKDAILDACGTHHGILHMDIDPSMEKGVIFMRCISDSAANQNYKVLHGWQFKDKLVSVRYFSLTAYRMMFPESEDSRLPLKSTNQRMRRLSGSRN